MASPLLINFVLHNFKLLFSSTKRAREINTAKCFYFVMHLFISPHCTFDKFISQGKYKLQYYIL